MCTGLLWQEPDPPRQRGGAPPPKDSPQDNEDMARANYFATLPVGMYLYPQLWLHSCNSILLDLHWQVNEIYSFIIVL